jgi:polyisoprenoid-binding protein YceI
VKKFILILLIVLLPGLLIVRAQRFISDSSYVHFFSSAPLENIEAYNIEGSSAIDIEKKTFAFKIPITGFQFKKSLMQEHFNENYMETEKYPFAFFSGRFKNIDEKEGSAKAVGVMEIHGVKKEIELEGFFRRVDDEIILQTDFNIHLKDYKIKIPRAVIYNIAEDVAVDVYFKFKPL